MYLSTYSKNIPDFIHDSNVAYISDYVMDISWDLSEECVIIFKDEYWWDVYRLNNYELHSMAYKYYTDYFILNNRLYLHNPHIINNIIEGINEVCPRFHPTTKKEMVVDLIESIIKDDLYDYMNSESRKLLIKMYYLYNVGFDDKIDIFLKEYLSSTDNIDNFIYLLQFKTTYNTINAVLKHHILKDEFINHIKSILHSCDSSVVLENILRILIAYVPEDVHELYQHFSNIPSILYIYSKEVAKKPLIDEHIILKNKKYGLLYIKQFILKNISISRTSKYIWYYIYHKIGLHDENEEC
jgi:hypothetical protein